MSPYDPRNIEERIVEDKTLSKGFISLHDSKNYPNRKVVDNKATNKLTGFAGNNAFLKD